MRSIGHHPASVGTQIRHFGRGATGHGSDQDAAHSGGSGASRAWTATTSVTATAARLCTCEVVHRAFKIVNGFARRHWHLLSTCNLLASGDGPGTVHSAWLAGG